MKPQVLVPWLAWLTQVQGSVVRYDPATDPDHPLAPAEFTKPRVCKVKTVLTTLTTTRWLAPSDFQSQGPVLSGDFGYVGGSALTTAGISEASQSEQSASPERSSFDDPAEATSELDEPTGFGSRTIGTSANSGYLDGAKETKSTSGIIPVNKTVPVITSTASTGIVELLPSLSSGVVPHTTGIVDTALNLTGAPTQNPLLTSSIPSPTSLLQPTVLTTTGSSKFTTGFSNMTTASTNTTTALSTSLSNDTISSSETAEIFDIEVAAAAAAATNIFTVPIATGAPPSSMARRSDHPVPRLGITSSRPIETNKFYANFFLGSQLAPTFTHPYSIAWAGGTGASASWGITISHIEASQRVYGDVKYNNAASYFINPIGIQSMVISAKELGSNTVLTTDSLTDFSARVLLSKDDTSQPAISFPIIQGMPYVTAQFDGATPLIQSGVYFRSMTRVTTDPKDNVTKYIFALEDGTTWLVYGYRTKGAALNLTIVNNGLAQSKSAFYGIIQVAKDPGTSNSQAYLDDGAGIYAVSNTISGSVSGSEGTYAFKFGRAGHSDGNIYMFALPHHIASFNSATKSRVKKFYLQTTTKGIATLVKGSVWTMVESSMPVNMGFAPWSPTKASRTSLSSSAKAVIKAVASQEVSQDMATQTNLDSMYYSGKALAKFGGIMYVINDLLGDTALASTGLSKLKSAFAVFKNQQQKYPLVYESAWGGIVSSASYTTGNSGDDFGNTYYNDHHFHYGYHILTAAYIGHLDSSWLSANKAYVNSLVRDIANPSTKDTYFPTWRSFDWYHGHSWAHGLYETYDGKDQESSSEDMMSLYAIKMWGTVIGDSNLVARANLQLAVLARSLQLYYLYESDNEVQPSQFIGNKVAGILFENKIDHTTYFGTEIEYIQGIHMIPILPPSAYIRNPTFVTQEWKAYFSSGRVNDIDDGWKGIIYGNYATVQPKQAWNFFRSSSFDSSWLDGGASLTWYLAYAGALAGV